ncbi:MAG: glycosyltransferase family 2 protein [Leptospiraceae bacterium]|nr:glycosyltransferase family 2 protein [Leptospiraceae bacterium]MCK6382400.1 glycosyltransferase family 2 protein [Leptospiraceae bacterium]NUM41839.1 glycosyltransferase family 2 protein [Leptospiraceae bacterium]
MPISACIITLNEEDILESCLKSLDFVDEIIIVDSHSTDRTLEIAKKYKAKTFLRKFDNYVNQKNYCLKKASHDWVLALDADEVVSQKLKQEILLLKENIFSKYDAFYLPRLSFYLGQWIYHGGWYPNYQIRLFKKSISKFEGQLVHEKVITTGKLSYLKNSLLHYSYKNISDHLKFIDKYSDLTAKERFREGKSCSVVLAVGKAFWKFVWMYFFRLGFLDGKAGLIISILGSYYNFLKYIKVYELKINSSRTNH